MATPVPTPRFLFNIGLVVSLLSLPSCRLAAQGFDPPPGGMLSAPAQVPQGDWVQVLTVTDKWLVLLNEKGQQFPVATDSVDTFVMRWPTTVDRLDETCLVEVTGLDLGNNRVGADHADVFRGPARNLVTPVIQHLVGFNRAVSPLALERQNLFGIQFQNLLSPQEMMIPRRIHAVAAPVNLNPLLLGVGGNNVVTVLPVPLGMSMTEVTTARNFQFVQPGDLAYVVSAPGGPTPRSLSLWQLVILKGVPLDQFGR